MPSLSSNKNKKGIPTLPVPATSVCIPVNVPDDPRWIALFLGAIYQLSQQIWYDRDAEHSAKIVADKWRDIYLETVKATWDCGGMFDLRIDPLDECSIQKTNDGETWIEVFRLDTKCSLSRLVRNPATGRLEYWDDFGFYEIPDGPWIDGVAPSYPEPKIRDNVDQSRCNAAYAGALALQLLYRRVVDEFVNWTTRGLFWAAEELLDTLDTIFGVFVPFDQMVDYLETLVFESETFTEGGFPDADLEAIQNILYCNSSITGGIVTFDYDAIYAEFDSVPQPTPAEGLRFMMASGWLTEDMINSVANINAGVGDCLNAECLESWSGSSFDGAGTNGFIAIPYNNNAPASGTACAATHDAINDKMEACLAGIISGNTYHGGIRIEKEFTPTTFHSLEIDYDNSQTGGGTKVAFNLYSGATLVYGNATSTVRTTRGTYVTPVTEVTADKLEIFLSFYSVGGGYGNIYEVRATGYGVNPFD